MAWSREGKEGGGGFKLLACPLNSVPVVVCGGWVGVEEGECLLYEGGLVSSLAQKQWDADSWEEANTLPAVRHHDHRRRPVHPAPQLVCAQCVWRAAEW